MSIQTFNDMKSHVGHEIACVSYGSASEPDTNVTTECITCGIVLIDLSPGQTIKVDDNDGKTISWSWSVDDVMYRARDKHINLSDQQCLEILHRINKGKDASIGINWDVIDSYTNDYLSEVSG